MNEPEQPAVAWMKCGPDCRYARSLPLAMGDWIWCVYRGAPRTIGGAALPCPSYAAGSPAMPDTEPRRERAPAEASPPTR